MKSEHEIQNEIRLAIGKEMPEVRLFRANVGGGWTGKIARRTADELLLVNYRRFLTGLPNGFPDLFGFREIDGKAVFVFIEVKRPGGRIRPEQERMCRFLRERGAIGGIAHSAEEALALLRREPS